jgi:hypothetical protein
VPDKVQAIQTFNYYRKHIAAKIAQAGFKTFFKRDRSRRAVHISQSLDASAIVFHRVSFDLDVVGVCQVTSAVRNLGGPTMFARIGIMSPQKESTAPVLREDL